MEKDKNKDKEIGSASLFIDGRAVSVSGSISRTPEHQTIIPTASVGSVSLGSVSTHLSSNINFDERWEFYDSSDIAALIASIKIEISSFNDNPENPSDKVIRKLAERYSVFWGSLKKFIRKDDTLSKTIAHKLFKDLVKYFDGVALNTSSDRILDNISLINRISNKKMDAIIIDFHYPVDKKISDYKKDIVKGHEVLEKAWHEFWKKYPIGQIEQIEHLANFQDDKDIENIFNENSRIYFRMLPPFMQRRMPDNKLEDNIRIGYFLMVFGWSDFFKDDEGTPLTDRDDVPLDEPKEFFRSPDLEHVIQKFKMEKKSDE